MSYLRCPQPSSLGPCSIVLFRIAVSLCLAIACGLAVYAQPPAPAQNDPEFKKIDTPNVTKILFYSSGVAQVTHAGEVDGNVTCELNFGGHDIDDALKSLVLEDPAGEFQVVVYPTAPTPQHMAAEEFRTPLTLAQTLQQFRGERIEFQQQNEKHTGTIFGVENRVKGQEVTETLVLMSELGLQTFAIANLTNIRFADEFTAKKFRDALVGMSQERDQSNKKQVFLQFKGNGKRTIRFSYLVDGPIWRLTYRLMYEDNQAMLQSWVHLDNVFGYDWKGVEVELRNGRPDAFHVELFAPIVAERRNIGLSAFEIPSNVTIVSQWYGMTPPHRFGDAQSRQDSTFRPGRELGGMGGMGGMGMGGMGGGFFGGPDSPTSGVGGDGGETGRAVGRVLVGERGSETVLDPRQVALVGDEQFQIDGAVVLQLKQRVSLPSGNSASVPVFEYSFPARKLTSVGFNDLIRTGSIGGLQMEITNDGETSLLTGPVAIFERGTFVGDGKLSRTAAQQKLIVDYGADLETSVRRWMPAATTRIVGMSRIEQRVRIDFETSQIVDFVLTNQHAENREIQLSFAIPIEGNEKWSRMDPALEVTNGLTKIVVPVTARGEAKRVFNFYRDHSREIAAQSAAESLKEWREKQIEIPQVVLELVEEFEKAKANHAANLHTVSRLKEQVAFFQSEQSRLARLVDASKSDPQTVQIYVAAIRQAETDLLEARKNLQYAETELFKSETELKRY